MRMEVGGERVDHGRQEHINLPLLAEDQFAIMSAHAFDGIAAIYRAATATIFPALILTSIGREHDIARIDAECFQQRNPKLMRRPNIEDAWNADSELRLWL
jgi:hypothetical protein